MAVPPVCSAGDLKGGIGELWMDMWMDNLQRPLRAGEAPYGTGRGRGCVLMASSVLPTVYEAELQGA